MAFLSHSHSNCSPAPVRRISVFDLIGLYRQRRALAALDDAALSDLGLTRTAVNQEAGRSFWDVPSNWCK